MTIKPRRPRGRFALKISQFAERAGDNADAAVREVVLEISRRIKIRTPVDTGRLRNNWHYSLNSPSTQRFGTPEEEAFSGAAANFQSGGGGGGGDTGPDIRGISAMPKDAASHTHIIQNNLPYARRIEYGHSKKAPAGMVRITLREFRGIVDKSARKARGK